MRDQAGEDVAMVTQVEEVDWFDLGNDLQKDNKFNSFINFNVRQCSVAMLINGVLYSIVKTHPLYTIDPSGKKQLFMFISNYILLK